MRYLMVACLLVGCRLRFDVAQNGDGGGTDADGPGEGMLDGMVDAAVLPNVMFVASGVTDLCSIGASGADAVCVARAAAAGLDGTFVSWTSQPGNDARDRIPAGVRGWVRRDGKPFADTLDDMIAGHVWYPPRIDESGNVLGIGSVMSGTTSAGRADTSTGCMLGGQTTYGGTRWYTGLVVGASAIICLEIDRDAPLAITPQTGRRAWIGSSTFTPSAGIGAADSICTTDAVNAGITGTVQAYMSTTTVTAASRFNLSGPLWVRPDGLPIVNATSDITMLDLQAAVSQHADGTWTEQFTWTGGYNGPSTSATCNNWSSASNSLMGLMYPATATTSNAFTSFSPSGCSFSTAGVLCLQN